MSRQGDSPQQLNRGEKPNCRGVFSSLPPHKKKAGSREAAIFHRPVGKQRSLGGFLNESPPAAYQTLRVFPTGCRRIGIPLPPFIPCLAIDLGLRSPKKGAKLVLLFPRRRRRRLGMRRGERKKPRLLGFLGPFAF